MLFLACKLRFQFPIPPSQSVKSKSEWSISNRSFPKHGHPMIIPMEFPHHRSISFNQMQYIFLGQLYRFFFFNILCMLIIIFIHPSSFSKHKHLLKDLTLRERAPKQYQKKQASDIRNNLNRTTKPSWSQKYCSLLMCHVLNVFHVKVFPHLE